ncbi:HAD family hydrolase [Dietzia psychralcaliphila]|uniref:HAD family hydrolase n=1 Tax=Dietzia psychralcaliphila TaxID=139021 RepID=UPI001C1E707F|nr:HAD-IB family hydrolase [Dietzia psychralcaliphila]
MNDHTDATDDSDSGGNRLRLPGRADVTSAIGRLAWRRRNARDQRVAGEASARNAVKLEPGVEPGPPLADATGTEDDDDHAATRFVPDPQAAAFFDVDNTLIQGASIILLARGLAKHKFFTAQDVAGMAWSQIKFRVSGNENADDVAAGRDKALSFVKGHTVAELTALSEEVVDTSMLDRVWPGTRSLVQMHLDAGQQVWLVTATPVMLARVIASRLGLSGALGTVAEEEDGVYTGRLVGDILHGPGKAHAISSLAEAEGFDLSKCYAYSDSFNDMPMLTMVGNPVAINPDGRLRKYASENGWDIKDFRTVRKAAKKAMPGVLAVGGLAGARAAVRSSYGVRTMGQIRRIF